MFSPATDMIGGIFNANEEVANFARLLLVVDDDEVIIPARLRLDGFLETDDIRIPPATRADIVMVEGSVVTTGCSVEVVVGTV